MNLKDKLIRKLLEVGKKHRILVYPTLALVAIISAVSHAVYWGKGNGKKLVASAMVMVMLITQSLFLTSSADTSSSAGTPNTATGTDAYYNSGDTGYDILDSDIPAGDFENTDIYGEGNNGINASSIDVQYDENGEIISQEFDLYGADDASTYAVYNELTVAVYRASSDGKTIDSTPVYAITKDNAIQISQKNDGSEYFDISQVTSLKKEDIAKAVYGVTDISGVDITDLYFDIACTEHVDDDRIAAEDLHIRRGALSLYFKAKRTAYNVVITNGENGADAKNIDYNTLDVVDDKIQFNVPNEQWAKDKELGKLGYKYAGLYSGTNKIAPGSAYTITKGKGTSNIDPDGNHNSVFIKAVFEPLDDIEIKFDVNPEKYNSIKIAEGMESVHTIEGVYDEKITLPSAAGWAELDGYELVGWKDGNHIYYLRETNEVPVSQLCTPMGNITDNPNVKGKTLEAVWQYKTATLVGNITTTVDNDSALTNNDDGVLVTAQYGDSISCEFHPVYKTDTTAGPSSNFKCEIAKEYDDRLLNEYGIKIQFLPSADDANQIIIGYDSHTVKKAGEIIVPVTITDKNTTKEDGSSIVTTCKITFNFAKRELYIDEKSICDANGSNPPSRMYNGGNKINLTPSGTVKSAIGDEGQFFSVEFDVEAVYGALEGRQPADAGENKPLTINGIHLKSTNPSLLVNYVLVDERTHEAIPDGGSCTLNIGEITPIPINVYTERVGEKIPILFGQDRPEFTWRIDTSKLIEADLQKYNNRVSDEAFAKDVLGFSGWETEWRRYKGTGEYSIYARYRNSSNYVVSESYISEKFVVNREDAAKDVNYKFDREPAPNGIYPGLIITACGEYDKIRLLKAGDTDVVDPELTQAQVAGLFSSTLDLTTGEYDGLNQNFRFQMYDSSTGAVTTIEDIQLSIDTTGPEYVTHFVSPALGYFNAFKFGSYYHSQSVPSENGKLEENMTITIVYTATGSEPKKLHYRYVNENGVPTHVEDSNMMFTKVSDSRWEADVIIGSSAADRGQLVVYAEDTTGNMSDVIKIMLDPEGKTPEIEGYDDKNPSKNYYEWMVENTPPISEITAQNMSGVAIPAGDTWYNGVTFVAKATDPDSGLYKMVWLVTTPDSEDKGEVVEEDTSPTNIQFATADGKVTSYNFEKTYQDSNLPVGAYYMRGVLYDNAGNCAELKEVGPFLIDCKLPRVEYKTDDLNASKVSKTLEFNVTEGEDESKIHYVVLEKKENGVWVEVNRFRPSPDAPDEECFMQRSCTISENGTYRIVAYDHAENKFETSDIAFGGISEEKPEPPTIAVSDGLLGKNGWYVETPVITITTTTKTPIDGIDVSTYYTINGNQHVVPYNSVRETITLREDGDIHIVAWAESATKVHSADVPYNVKVDSSAPVIDMKESVIDAEGRVTINFTAYDTVSGININSAKLNGNNLMIRESDGTISGSFVVANEGTYEITVEDMAGNVAKLEFVPLAMSVSPITDITSTGAKIDAKIYTGTYDLSNCYIAYRKAGTTSYETAPANKRTQSYGASLDYEFSGLTPDTVYEYRVYAVTKTSRETKVVEGSFRTGDGKSTTAVYGNVKYADSALDNAKTTPIYVSLFDGNTYIAGKKLDIEGGDYNFTNISDGTYRVVATNGAYTQTKSVIVENGTIVYPTDYLTTRGVNFVLGRLSTHMVLNGAVKVTADGLDQVFDRNYTAVITEEDWYAYDNEGASIDITLYADYLDVTDVSSTTQGVFADKIGKNHEIVRYIELNVVKTVKNADGEILYTKDVTRLVKPITVAFPLGDLSGQKIGVASMHGSGNDAQFINWSDGEAVLTKNYIAITTSRFSIYALYKVDAAPKSYTVTWKDGDGNTMKVETVTDGGSATPPVTTPRKTATDKYTYTFSGWDTDYSKITKDTIISAWFTANNVNGGNNNDPANSGDNNNPGGNNGDNSNNNENPEAKPPLITNNTPQYSYLGSAQSPNTGDEAPIAVLAFVMLLSMSGMVVVIKKQKKH